MKLRLWWQFVQFGFRLLYNEFAWTYDLVSWIVSLGDWRNWQRAALRHIPADLDAPILEMAHGTGSLQIDLCTAGVTAVAIDLSPNMGRIASAKLQRHGIQPWLLRSTVQQLPFADATFPAIISTFPTEFILEAVTVRESYRVLQPGGRLIVVYSGVILWGGVVKSLLEWAYRVTGQRGGLPRDVLATYREAGFSLKQAEVSFERSKAVVLIAEKGHI